MKKRIIFIVSLIVIISLFAYLLLKDVGRREFNLTFAPGSATIKIDGKEIKKTKCKEDLCKINLKLTNSVQEISLTKDNFTTETIRIKNNLDNKLFLISTPATNEGEIEYQEDELMQLQIQNASSEKFSYGSVKISEKYPFLDQLNIYGGGFTIGYGQSSYSKRDPYSVSLFVEAKEPKYRLDAVNSIINELGVSPADIEIIYNNFNNPFNSEQ